MITLPSWLLSGMFQTAGPSAISAIPSLNILLLPSCTFHFIENSFVLADSLKEQIFFYSFPHISFFLSVNRHLLPLKTLLSTLLHLHVPPLPLPLALFLFILSSNPPPLLHLPNLLRAPSSNISSALRSRFSPEGQSTARGLCFTGF